MRWDSEPRRGPREEVAPTLRSSTPGRSGGAKVNGTDRAALVAEEVAGTLCANGKAAGSATQQDAESGLLIAEPPALLCFDETQITHPENRSNARGDTSPALAPGARPPTIAYPTLAFNARQDPVFIEECSPPLDTDPNTNAICVTGEVTHALTSVGADASEDGTGRGTPIIPTPNWKVRRLTPLECERLQSFPDGWTAIPKASDSARYAALGNSMNAEVIRWLGRRIQMVDDILRGEKTP